MIHVVSKDVGRARLLRAAVHHSLRNLLIHVVRVKGRAKSFYREFNVEQSMGAAALRHYYALTSGTVDNYLTSKFTDKSITKREIYNQNR
jgi:hypothetical protein